jgi:uncharacterized protein (DUF1800 family)
MFHLSLHSNTKAHPNENYGREFMELMTLGVGHYTEQDVKEISRAFTGITSDYKTSKVWLNKNTFDNKDKTILDKTANFDADQAIDWVLEQSRTAEFVTTKVLNNFYSHEASADDVKRFAKIYRDSQYDMSVLLNAIFNDEGFYKDGDSKGLFLSPVEWLVLVLKATGVKLKKGMIRSYLVTCGQELMNPPSIAGWKVGKYWINESLIASKFRISGLLPSLVYTKTSNPHQGKTSTQAIDDWADKLRISPSDSTIDALSAYKSNNPTIDQLKSILKLLLMSPELQKL